jgi:hypothetical protein
MTNRPRLFIGSASETEEIANRIGEALEEHVELHLWSNVFALGELNLQALQREAAECDFALFVWGIEDITVARGKKSNSPRDNVVYEAGLFAGALGEHRVFVAHAENTKIPSDYLGITTAVFDPLSPDIQRIADRIRGRIEQLGEKPAMRLSGYWWQLVLTEDDKSVVSFVRVRPQGDGRSVSMGGHSWTEGGKMVARWDTIATQFDERTETLHYSWEGKLPRKPGIPLYFGVGTIRYGMSPIMGDFSSTKRHQEDKPELSRFKSAFYIPAQPEHVVVMTNNDSSAWHGLITEILELRESFD